MKTKLCPAPSPEELRKDFLPLPRLAMQEVQSAAQTFGALLRLLKTRQWEFFGAQEAISDMACLPRRTVQRHLELLSQSDWILDLGRDHRRTCTYQLTEKASKHYRPFAMLPRWVIQNSSFDFFETWAECAVYACLFSQHEQPEAIERHGLGCGDGRDSMSFKEIQDRTGLSWSSLQRAKSKLLMNGMILRWEGLDWRSPEMMTINTNTFD